METMLMGRRKGKWDYRISLPEDANTLFRMGDFSSNTDIKDKGPNKLAIATQVLNVGQDALGGYMNFDGNSWFQIMPTALLNRTNMEVNFIIGYPDYYPHTYSGPLLDTRPVNTNGDDYIIGPLHNVPGPYQFFINYPATNSTLTSKLLKPEDCPALITLQIRPSGVTFLVNGEIWHQQSLTGPMPMNYMKIGHSGFSGAVPNYHGKIYYLDFKAI